MSEIDRKLGPVVGADSGASASPVVLPESGTEFYVEFVWWDGKPGHFHISCNDLTDYRSYDEAPIRVLRRTWTKVVVCENIFTCSHGDA